jgi:hypothetical protein
MNHPSDPFSAAILDQELLGWVLFGGFVLAIIAMRSVVGIVRTVTRERTRREIAAYIAEGSMTPEQGERLMKAGKSCD